MNELCNINASSYIKSDQLLVEYSQEKILNKLQTYVYMYMCKYKCMCVCAGVCVCVHECVRV